MPCNLAYSKMDYQDPLLTKATTKNTANTTQKKGCKASFKYLQATVKYWHILSHYLGLVFSPEAEIQRGLNKYQFSNEQLTVFNWQFAVAMNYFSVADCCFNPFQLMPAASVRNDD